MNPDMSISISEDTAIPALQNLQAALSPSEVKRAVGSAVVRTIQHHLLSLPPNKRGWPSSGFYKGAARGVDWEPTEDGVTIGIDNEDRPGAIRQRYHGGTIRMKDKLLAIPARQEFYAKSPTEFTNLRLVVFRSGAKALVIGKGGAGRVDFATGRERNVSGAGARAALMVAYWLKEEVHQQADASVLPTEKEMAESAVDGVMRLLIEKGVVK